MAAYIAKHFVMTAPRSLMSGMNRIPHMVLRSASSQTHHTIKQMWRTFHKFSRTAQAGTCTSRELLLKTNNCSTSYGKYQAFVSRCLSSRSAAKAREKGLKTTAIYFCATGVFMLGMAYAGVPLYRIFCSATGLGGKATVGHDSSKVESMEPVEDRIITVQFNADVHSSMQWNFRPQQMQVKVAPGETALAFYSAKNPTDKPIVGISTYNIIPYQAGQYFNKIQCFCFEEQRLNPHEKVDMPVFFFIDPEYAEDPKLEGIDKITLSYTFFEAKEGMHIPLPGYMQPHQVQGS